MASSLMPPITSVHQAVRTARHDQVLTDVQFPFGVTRPRTARALAPERSPPAPAAGPQDDVTSLRRRDRPANRVAHRPHHPTVGPYARPEIELTLRAQQWTVPHAA